MPHIVNIAVGSIPFAEAPSKALVNRYTVLFQDSFLEPHTALVTSQLFRCKLHCLTWRKTMVLYKASKPGRTLPVELV